MHNKANDKNNSNAAPVQATAAQANANVPAPPAQAPQQQDANAMLQGFEGMSGLDQVRSTDRKNTVSNRSR